VYLSENPITPRNIAVYVNKLNHSYDHAIILVPYSPYPVHTTGDLPLTPPRVPEKIESRQAKRAQFGYSSIFSYQDEKSAIVKQC